MKILSVHEGVVPISSSIRNAWIDFSAMDCSIVAVVSDVIRDGKPLVFQLNGLERRRGRTGRDTIDHAKGAHDDLINAAAGALVLAQDGSATSVPGFGRVINYANQGIA